MVTVTMTGAAPHAGCRLRHFAERVSFSLNLITAVYMAGQATLTFLPVPVRKRRLSEVGASSRWLRFWLHISLRRRSRPDRSVPRLLPPDTLASLCPPAFSGPRPPAASRRPSSGRLLPGSPSVTPRPQQRGFLSPPPCSGELHPPASPPLPWPLQFILARASPLWLSPQVLTGSGPPPGPASCSVCPPSGDSPPRFSPTRCCSLPPPSSEYMAAPSRLGVGASLLPHPPAGPAGSPESSRGHCSAPSCHRPSLHCPLLSPEPPHEGPTPFLLVRVPPSAARVRSSTSAGACSLFQALPPAISVSQVGPSRVCVAGGNTEAQNRSLVCPR